MYQRDQDRVRAEQLRVAAALVERFAPDSDQRQRRDRTDILRRLGLLVAGLERHQIRAVCRHCEREFFFDAAWFDARNMSRPTHCNPCRLARRQERRRAGAGTALQ
jgi:hypothetical protein